MGTEPRREPRAERARPTQGTLGRSGTSLESSNDDRGGTQNSASVPGEAGTPGWGERVRKDPDRGGMAHRGVEYTDDRSAVGRRLGSAYAREGGPPDQGITQGL